MTTTPPGWYDDQDDAVAAVQRDDEAGPGSLDSRHVLVQDGDARVEDGLR